MKALFKILFMPWKAYYKTMSEIMEMDERFLLLHDLIFGTEEE